MTIANICHKDFVKQNRKNTDRLPEKPRWKSALSNGSDQVAGDETCGDYRAGGAATDDDHIILHRTPAFLFSGEVCFVFAAKICPTRVAKGISSAAYRSLARGLALSLRTSTIVVA